MKALRINPQDFDISLDQKHVEPGLAEVMFKFGDTSGEAALTDTECVKIGSWFQSLAVHLKNEKRKYGLEKLRARKPD
jgi:hypothetical protein